MTFNPETIPLLCQPHRRLSRLTTRVSAAGHMVGCRSHLSTGSDAPTRAPDLPGWALAATSSPLVSSTCGASWGSARPCDPAPWGRARGARTSVSPSRPCSEPRDPDDTVRNTAAPRAPLQVLPANVLPEMSPCAVCARCQARRRRTHLRACRPGLAAGSMRAAAAAAPVPATASVPAGAQGRPGRARAARLHMRIVHGAAVLARGVVAEDAAGQAAVAGAAEHGAAAGGRVQVELAVVHVARRALRGAPPVWVPRPPARPRPAQGTMRPSAAVRPQQRGTRAGGRHCPANARRAQSSAPGCNLAPAARAAPLSARAPPDAGARWACGDVPACRWRRPCRHGRG